MNLKRKRHPITLLEIMIVILLIGLIGGVLSYNLKGTLDRGKKFRTEEGIRRLKEILDFEIQQGHFAVADLIGSKADDAVKRCVIRSEFIPLRDVDNFLLDGWKESYSYTQDMNGELYISSYRLEEYLKLHPNG